jgi:hypothetical protein
MTSTSRDDNADAATAKESEDGSSEALDGWIMYSTSIEQKLRYGTRHQHRRSLFYIWVGALTAFHQKPNQTYHHHHHHHLLHHNWAAFSRNQKNFNSGRFRLPLPAT